MVSNATSTLSFEAFLTSFCENEKISTGASHLTACALPCNVNNSHMMRYKIWFALQRSVDARPLWRTMSLMSIVVKLFGQRNVKKAQTGNF